MPKRTKEFSQVCVLCGIVVGKGKEDELVKFFKDEFDIRAKYLEEVVTLPDPGDECGETGGRNDLFFAVHKDDVDKFAIPRLQYGIKWFEDLFNNGGGELYEDRERLRSFWKGTSSTHPKIQGNGLHMPRRS